MFDDGASVSSNFGGKSSRYCCCCCCCCFGSDLYSLTIDTFAGGALLFPPNQPILLQVITTRFLAPRSLHKE